MKIKRQTIINIFKDIGFNPDIQTNLKELDFLDVKLNLKMVVIVHTKTLTITASTHRRTIHHKS